VVNFYLLNLFGYILSFVYIVIDILKCNESVPITSEVVSSNFNHLDIMYNIDFLNNICFEDRSNELFRLWIYEYMCNILCSQT
jgi:hypothetical protein